MKTNIDGVCEPKGSSSNINGLGVHLKGTKENRKGLKNWLCMLMHGPSRGDTSAGFPFIRETFEKWCLRWHCPILISQ